MLQCGISYFCIIVLVSFSFNSAHNIFYISFPDLSPNELININLTHVSKECQEVLEKSWNDSLNFWKMIDATSKLESDLIELKKFYFLGDYGECLRIENPTYDLFGKYCLGTLPFKLLLNKYIKDNLILKYNIKLPRNLLEIVETSEVKVYGQTEKQFLGFHFGVCLPDKCTAQDFQNIFFNKLIFSEDLCSYKRNEPNLTTGAIVTISVLAFFGLLTIVSTALDLYLFNKGKKSPHPLLTAFSIYSNGKKIFSSTTNSDHLLCLSGLRTITIIWIILSHEYILSLKGPVTNFLDLYEWNSHAENMFVVGGTLAVDTFFVLAGLVTVYAVLKAADIGIKFNIFIYYIHRYIRLTPLLAIIIFINRELVQYMGRGPQWKNVEEYLVNPCKDYWWSCLLYIQNYVHGKENCVPHTWFLSVDFQLFLLSPIVLIPLKRKRNIGLLMIVILIIAGILIPFEVTYYYEIPTLMTSIGINEENFMWKYYKQTYARFGPYVIGMLAGYFVYKLRKSNKVTIPPIYVLGLWLISLTVLVSCLFGTHPLATATEYDRMANSIASAAIRNGWAIALCILIILCVTGYGGPINWFLSLPIFQMLAKISYAMYLIHYPLIFIKYSQTKEPIIYGNSTMMWLFWPDFALIIFLAFIFCIVFESPVIIIEKLMFGRALRPKSRNPVAES